MKNLFDSLVERFGGLAQGKSREVRIEARHVVATVRNLKNITEVQPKGRSHGRAKIYIT